MAHAMSRTLEATPNTPLDGASLMEQLLNLTFTGASGPIGFDEHGDRDVGLSYEMHTLAGSGLSLLGRWQQG